MRLAPQLAVATSTKAMTALNSPNDNEVIAAFDLLADQDRVRLIPALILYHPSHRVVVRALELFAQIYLLSDIHSPSAPPRI